MFKKLFITLLLVLSFVQTPVLAADEVGTQGGGTRDPQEDIASEEFQFDLGVITHEDIEEANFVRQGINFIIQRTITIMAVTVGSAAVFMSVVGGFMILISAGNENLKTKGRSYILKSLIGLAVVLGAYVIVTTILFLINSIYG